MVVNKDGLFERKSQTGFLYLIVTVKAGLNGGFRSMGD